MLVDITVNSNGQPTTVTADVIVRIPIDIKWDKEQENGSIPPE